MKRLITLAILLLMSISAFASMEDCVNAIRQDNWDNGIKYCKPLADENNKDAIGLVARAYTELEDGIQAQKYFQIYADKYGKTENNLVLLGGVYASLGNAYYFGAYGAKKDIKKGLKYITKGAQLGNSIAQEQLATAYFNGDNLPVNYPLAYMWYTISASNGNQKAINNYFAQHMASYTQQAPYCVALGDHLVAKAYLDGKGGLPKSDNQAKKYLIQAIELYKESKKTTKDELKYCPPQKGLDLASAEKLLASLQ